MLVPGVCYLLCLYVGFIYVWRIPWLVGMLVLLVRMGLVLILVCLERARLKDFDGLERGGYERNLLKSMFP